MKKLLSFMTALAVLLPGMNKLFAQNYTLSVDENNVVWDGFSKSMTPDELGVEIEKREPERVFVYVNYDTPIGLTQDIQNAIAMSSTAEVIFLNPDSYADKGREYGPIMAMHVNFLEWSLLEQTKKMGRHIEFTASKDNPDKLLPDGVDTLLRSRDEDGDLVNIYDTVCINLDTKTSVGAVYGSLYTINEKSHGPKGEMIPGINVIFKVPDSDYSREAYFRIIETDPTLYEFENYTAARRSVWAVYRREDVMDTDDFANSIVAFKSISEIDLPGARPGKGRAIVEMTVTPLGTLRDIKILRSSGIPGLDEVIVKAVSEAPAYWVPQRRNGNPVNIKVTIPIQGEIGAY